MNKAKVSNFLQRFSIFIILIVMFLICSILSPYFFTANNLINVARQLCVGVLLAYAEMILIVSGFLDLSIGSVLALSGVMACSVYKATQSMVLALAVALAVGVACNLINALFVAQFNVPAFIATLGMQQMARGIALYYTNGANVLQIGKFVNIGQGMVGPIPVPVLIVAGITVLIWYLFNHTRFGRSLYAIGGNRKAAEASGINAKKNIWISYIIVGLLAGLAGVIFMARNNSGIPNGAIGYEMTGLTAAIVGGTSFSGGVGTVMGTVVGAFIIGFLENIMNLIGVNSYIQSIIEGAIIVLAVAFDIRSKTRKTSKQIMAVKDAPPPPKPGAAGSSG